MTERPLWVPSKSSDTARIWSLLELINQRYDVELPRTYGALHRWSVQYPGEFWAAVWDLGGIPGDRGERLFEAGERFQDARFLPDAQVNVAEALLARWGTPDGVAGPAISFLGEDGETAELSGSHLRGLVAQIQAALMMDGVRPGDRVAAVVSNRPEAYALMIAAASIGAVFTSVSPDFGVDGILERFAQVEPVVLVAVGRYVYGGREYDIRSTLAAVAEGLPSVRQRILVATGADRSHPADLAGWTDWAGWLAPHRPGEPTFERFGSDQPWYVLYSSGTTGRPKCIVHRAVGVLLKHVAEHGFQHDLGPGDRLCFFTTAGLGAGIRNRSGAVRRVAVLSRR